MNVDEEEDLPTFDLPDAPSRDEDNFSKLNDSLGSPTVQAQSVEAVDLGSQVEYEDMSSFKKVIVVEVEMNIIPSKPLVSESTELTSTGYTHYPRITRHPDTTHSAQPQPQPQDPHLDLTRETFLEMSTGILPEAHFRPDIILPATTCAPMRAETKALGQRWHRGSGRGETHTLIEPHMRTPTPTNMSM